MLTLFSFLFLVVCLFVWLVDCLFVVWLFVCLFGCLCVVHLFQVPEKTNVPNSWSFNSKKKGYKRYYTPETLGWKEQLELIDEEIQECTSNRLRTLFRTFSRSHVALKMACKCIARLDALMSLACASEHIQNGENEDAWPSTGLISCRCRCLFSVCSLSMSLSVLCRCLCLFSVCSLFSVLCSLSVL